MKLFTYKRQDRFGIEHNYALLQGKRKSALQFSFGYYQDDTVGMPYLQISMGHGSLLSTLFVLGKYSVAFDLFGHNWCEL